MQAVIRSINAEGVKPAEINCRLQRNVEIIFWGDTKIYDRTLKMTELFSAKEGRTTKTRLFTSKSSDSIITCKHTCFISNNKANSENYRDPTAIPKTFYIKSGFAVNVWYLILLQKNGELILQEIVVCLRYCHTDRRGYNENWITNTNEITSYKL